MAEAIRFYFDEHIRNAVTSALRRHGVDVWTAVELGRTSLPDEDQLRFATVHQRVMTTHDVDYLFLASDFQQRGEPFAGVAFCDYEKFANNPRRLIRELLTLHGVYTADDMRDHVEYL